MTGPTPDPVRGSAGSRSEATSGSALDLTVRDYLAEVAAPTPSATGGSVCAVTAAAAAGLVAMTAKVSQSLDDAGQQAERLQEQAAELAVADSDVYQAVLAAQRRPKDDPGRTAALREALEAAAQPPLRIARLAAEVASLAAHVAARGKRVLRGDAVSAATLAAGAARGAATLVRINLTSAGLPPSSASEAETAAASAQRSADAASESRQ